MIYIYLIGFPFSFFFFCFFCLLQLPNSESINHFLVGSMNASCVCSSAACDPLSSSRYSYRYRWRLRLMCFYELFNRILRLVIQQLRSISKSASNRCPEMLSGLSNCKMLKRFACCFSWLRKAKWFQGGWGYYTHAQCSSFSCPQPHSKLNRIHLHVLYGFSLSFFLLLLLLLMLLLRLIFHLIPVRFTWECAQHIDWLGEWMNGCVSVSVWGSVSVSEYITIRYFVCFFICSSLLYQKCCAQFV